MTESINSIFDEEIITNLFIDKEFEAKDLCENKREFWEKEEFLKGYKSDYSIRHIINKEDQLKLESKLKIEKAEYQINKYLKSLDSRAFNSFKYQYTLLSSAKKKLLLEKYLNKLNEFTQFKLLIKSEVDWGFNLSNLSFWEGTHEHFIYMISTSVNRNIKSILSERITQLNLFIKPSIKINKSAIELTNSLGVTIHSFETTLIKRDKLREFNKQKKHLQDLCNDLRSKNLLDTGTSYESLRNIFLYEPVKTKIKWIATKGDCQYFINKLIEIKFIIKSYKKFKIGDAVFNLSNSKFKTLSGKIETSPKKSDIDSIIQNHFNQNGMLKS